VGEADHLEAANAYKVDQYNHYKRELESQLKEVYRQLRAETRTQESKRRMSNLMGGEVVYSYGTDNALKVPELEAEHHRIETALSKYYQHFESKMLLGVSRRVANLRLDVAERKRRLHERIESTFTEERRRLSAIEKETMKSTRKAILSYVNKHTEYERDILLGKTAIDTRRKLRETLSNSHLTLYENLFQRNFFPHAYDLVIRDISRLTEAAQLRRASAEADLISQDGDVQVLTNDADEIPDIKDLSKTIPVRDSLMSSTQILSKAQSSVLARRMLEMLQRAPHPLADYGIYNADHPIHDDYGHADELKGSNFVSRQLSEDGLSINVVSRRADDQSQVRERLLSAPEVMKDATEDYDEEERAEALTTGSRKASSWALNGEYTSILNEQGLSMDDSFSGWDLEGFRNSVGVIGSPRRKLSLNSYKNDRFLKRVEEMLATETPAHLTEAEASKRRLDFEELYLEHDADYIEGEINSFGFSRRRLMSQQVSTECTSGSCSAQQTACTNFWERNDPVVNQILKGLTNQTAGAPTYTGKGGAHVFGSPSLPDDSIDRVCSDLDNMCHINTTEAIKQVGQYRKPHCYREATNGNWLDVSSRA
jgi:hypothetical protein